MPTVTMTDMSGQEEANKVKELVVDALVAEGYLDAGKAEEFLSSYCVILRARSWLGRLVDKAFGTPPEQGAMYQMARLVRYPAPAVKGEP